MPSTVAGLAAGEDARRTFNFKLESVWLPERDRSVGSSARSDSRRIGHARLARLQPSMAAHLAYVAKSCGYGAEAAGSDLGSQLDDQRDILTYLVVCFDI